MAIAFAFTSEIQAVGESIGRMVVASESWGLPRTKCCSAIGRFNGALNKAARSLGWRRSEARRESRATRSASNGLATEGGSLR